MILTSQKWRFQYIPLTEGLFFEFSRPISLFKSVFLQYRPSKDPLRARYWYPGFIRDYQGLQADTVGVICGILRLKSFESTQIQAFRFTILSSESGRNGTKLTIQSPNLIRPKSAHAMSNTKFFEPLEMQLSVPFLIPVPVSKNFALPLVLVFRNVLSN